MSTLKCPRGIRNINLTCYLNSAIQFITSLDRFNGYISNHLQHYVEDKEETCTWCEMITLVICMNRRAGPVPGYMMHNFVDKLNIRRDGEQDVREMLDILLRQCFVEVLPEITMKIRKIVTCLSCKDVTRIVQDCYFLTLPEGAEMANIIEDYFEEKAIDHDCDECGNKIGIEKQLIRKNVPEIIVHFPRCQKLDPKEEFNVLGVPYVFRLFIDYVNENHYVTYKNVENVWHKINDESVRRIKAKNEYNIYLGIIVPKEDLDRTLDDSVITLQGINIWTNRISKLVIDKFDKEMETKRSTEGESVSDTTGRTRSAERKKKEQVDKTSSSPKSSNTDKGNAEDADESKKKQSDNVEGDIEESSKTSQAEVPDLEGNGSSKPDDIEEINEENPAEGDEDEDGIFITRRKKARKLPDSDTGTEEDVYRTHIRFASDSDDTRVSKKRIKKNSDENSKKKKKKNWRKVDESEKLKFKDGSKKNKKDYITVNDLESRMRKRKKTLRDAVAKKRYKFSEWIPMEKRHFSIVKRSFNRDFLKGQTIPGRCKLCCKFYGVSFNRMKRHFQSVHLRTSCKIGDKIALKCKCALVRNRGKMADNRNAHYHCPSCGYPVEKGGQLGLHLLHKHNYDENIVTEMIRELKYI